MAIGERIHFFRNKRGMTMKQLGQAVGFPENSADVRLAQYEAGARTPKADLTAVFATVLDVVPEALAVPDIDSYIGMMHTLFCLEDRYGLVIDEQDGEPVLRVDASKGTDAAELQKMLLAWAEQSKRMQCGEIPEEEYDNWRYRYPKHDTSDDWVKTPSQELSDAMVEAFKDRLKNM